MFRELLSEEFPLTTRQLDQLEEHFKLLTLWNKRLNLTRITDPKEAVYLHYCESLFLARMLPTGQHRVVDIGSGAGFPGIPFAVYRSECSVDLVEAHHRKSVFLREATRSLSNVTVRAERAESLPVNQYDWLIARAVNPKEVLSLRLAANIAILMSADFRDPVPSCVTKVPWGQNRVVGLFHVKL